MLITAGVCRAQQGTGKTAVFKVRAPISTCTIKTDTTFFWLEKDNNIRVIVKGRNKNIRVIVTGPGGKIVAENGDTYTLRFSAPGLAAVSVFQVTDKGNQLLLTKHYNITGPVLYFCGIRIDSTSRVIKLRNDNLYAWSAYYKQALPVISFQMYFNEDTTRDPTKVHPKPIIYTSDTSMLSRDMRDKLLHYQPHYNFIYFYSIICRVPDGTKRILDPIRLHVVEDTADHEKISLIYAVYRKKE